MLDTAQDNPLFAPVKLEGITGTKMQGDERLSRSGIGALEVSDETLNRRIGPGIPFRHKLLIKPYGRLPLPARTLLILLEELLKPRVKSIAKLMTSRWRLPLIAWRVVVLQILLDRVARQTGCTRHRPDAA